MGQFDSERWYIVVMGSEQGNYRLSTAVQATSADEAREIALKVGTIGLDLSVWVVWFCGMNKPEICD